MEIKVKEYNDNNYCILDVSISEKSSVFTFNLYYLFKLVDKNDRINFLKHVIIHQIKTDLNIEINDDDFKHIDFNVLLISMELIFIDKKEKI
jgi:hypothetical protein